MFFQVRFCDSKGNGHFAYFEADPSDMKKVKELAEETANADLLRQRQNRGMDGIFSSSFRPIKTVMVKEYDNVKKDIKRKGITFKLRYMWLRTKRGTGYNAQYELQEWYSAV